MSNLRRSYATAKNAPKAMVVHCSDHRFQPAFAEFISDELLLPPGHYVPLVFRGGAGNLARHHTELDYAFVASCLNLHRNHSPEIERLVLITHENCKYYASLIREDGDHPDSQSRRDLAMLHPAIHEPAIPAEFASLIRQLDLRVEAYYAHFLDDSQTAITFDLV